MKLIYESNACCVENLILSSREHSKAFISESSTSSSASSCSASDEHEAQDVRKINYVIFLSIELCGFSNHITQRRSRSHALTFQYRQW